MMVVSLSPYVLAKPSKGWAAACVSVRTLLTPGTSMSQSTVTPQLGGLPWPRTGPDALPGGRRPGPWGCPMKARSAHAVDGGLCLLQRRGGGRVVLHQGFLQRLDDR